MNQKCVLILDDHQLFGESFAVLLEKYTEVEMVYTFQGISELIRFLSQHTRQKFFIFLDYYLKDTNGLAVLSDVRRLNKLSKIIFLTSVSNWQVVYNIESHFPDAIVSKTSGLDVLLECMQIVDKGERYLCPFFQALKSANQDIRLVSFTARELEILRFFVSGHTIAETAEKTFLSRHTIVAHRRNMMAKAKCTSINQLLNYVNQCKLV